MPQYALLAFAVFTVTSLTMLVAGRRFARRFFAKHGAMPPWNWMFRKTTDPDLEGPRRTALVTMPLFIASLLVYLFAQQQV
jgi:hypothetical protein